MRASASSVVVFNGGQGPDVNDEKNSSEPQVGLLKRRY